MGHSIDCLVPQFGENGLDTTIGKRLAIITRNISSEGIGSADRRDYFNMECSGFVASASCPMPRECFSQHHITLESFANALRLPAWSRCIHAQLNPEKTAALCLFDEVMPVTAPSSFRRPSTKFSRPPLSLSSPPPPTKQRDNRRATLSLFFWPCKAEQPPAISLGLPRISVVNLDGEVRKLWG